MVPIIRARGGVFGPLNSPPGAASNHDDKHDDQHDDQHDDKEFRWPLTTT
jgi:hypothetical protein